MHVFDWPRSHLNDISARTFARSKWPSYALTVTTLALIMALTAPGSARADDEGGDYGGEIDTYADEVASDDDGSDSYADETDFDDDGMDSDEDGTDFDDDETDFDDDETDSDDDETDSHGMDSDDDRLESDDGMDDGPLYDISETDDPIDNDGTGANGGGTSGGGGQTEHLMNPDPAAVIQAIGGIVVQGILNEGPAEKGAKHITYIGYTDDAPPGTNPEPDPDDPNPNPGPVNQEVPTGQQNPTRSIIIEPVTFPVGTRDRIVQRNKLYREVRDLQNMVAGAKRVMQRIKERSSWLRNDESRRNALARDYEKIQKAYHTLKASLATEQVHLAMLQFLLDHPDLDQPR